MPAGERSCKLAGGLSGPRLYSLASAIDTEDTPKLDTELEVESPWPLIPTISSDPKLGSTLGAVAGYIKDFD